MPQLVIYFFALLLGALHAFSFAPTPLGSVQIAALMGLLALLRTTAHPVKTTLAFCVTWFGAGLYWLHFSMHDIGGLPTALSILAILILALCLSTFYALAIRFWARWRVGTTSETIALCVAFPLVWLAAELARGYVFFGGFPWLATGYAQVDNPLLKGWFAIFGVYGVGLLSAFMAGALLSLLLCGLKIIQSRQTLAALAGATGLLAVAGLIVQGVSWGSDAGAPLQVRMVQTNVAQNLKFDTAEMAKNTELFMQQAANSPAPLTVFPETALPFPWDNLPDSMLQPLQNSLGSRAVLMGAVGTDERGFYNSAMWLDAQSDLRNPARYDKTHLLPFGETIPTGFKWFIDLMNIPLGGYQKGHGFTPFTLQHNGANVRVAANICFENTFGEELISAWRNSDAAAPQIWVNMTNLGWFGTHQNSTNQAQHLQMSRARAMEMARPMLVVTNTGSTAQIDAMGAVLNAPPTEQTLTQDVSVQPRNGMTPYVALGNAPMLALLSLAFGFMVLRRHRKVNI
ncbi:MAG: apolipoprotein N-acyltransferase [Formosimonas sp.]